MLRKTLAALAALSSLDTAGLAQTAAPHPVPVQARCALPLVADKVQLNPVPGSDLLTVPVALNGTQKQFLLDIGTKPDEVSVPVVKELGLPGATQSNDALLGSSAYSNGAFQYRDMTRGTQLNAAMFDVRGSRSAEDYAQRVVVGSVTLGTATGHNLLFVIANDRDMGKSEPFDGRLTASFFAQYDIDFDFGGRELSFLTATSCTDPDQVAYWPHTVVAVMPMKLSGGKISVPVTINGHQIDAVLDTGSASTVMRRDIAERTLGLKADTPDMTALNGARDGTGLPVYSHTFPQISFAGVTAVNVPARIQSNSMVRKIDRTPILGSRAQFAADRSLRIPDLAIGMDVLTQLHLYAAFGENKLYVTAAK